MMRGRLDTVDKYMLGAVLFAIFSRSRWSDLQYIHRFWVARNESKYELTATFIELNMCVVSLLVVNFNNLQDEPVKGI